MSAKKTKATETLTIQKPSILSFKRKLEASHGLLYSGVWKNRDVEVIKVNKDGKEYEVKAWKPLKIEPVKTLGTQSSFKTAESDRAKPNPVAAGGDSVTLPEGADTLLLKYTVRVIGGLSKPEACNRPDFQELLETKIEQDKTELIPILAYRFAYNIANGRFLWRNRVGAEDIKIKVKIDSSIRSNGENEKQPSKNLTFNAYDYSLKDFDYINPKCEKAQSDLETLANAIKQGLLSEDDFVLLSVEAYVKLGTMQQVYPSQEMITEKGKKLFRKDEQAGMHDVKISNAIKTIDTWYSNEHDVSPIAIEPWGAVTQRNQAYRSGNKPANDLYSLLEKWIIKKEVDVSKEDKAFVIANLIRGGLFQMVKDNK